MTKLEYVNPFRSLKTGLGNNRLKCFNFLLTGDRRPNIQLTILRHRCSSLNVDLYHVYIIPNAACRHGAQFETAEQFFFDRFLYSIQRQRLIH